jgi:hypothetical protein
LTAHWRPETTGSASPIIGAFVSPTPSGKAPTPSTLDEQHQKTPGLPVRKTYLLNVEGKNRDRLLDAAKHDIRKYVKRERSRPLPPGVDFFDFDCKLGASEAAAESLHLATLMTAVDALVKDGADQFYVEVVTKPGHRSARPMATGANDGSLGDSE